MFVDDALSGLSRLAVMALALSLLAACSKPSDPERAPVGKFAWFDMLNGDDIRQNCMPAGASSPDRYRFVYNARFTQHVHIYDLVLKPDGTAALTSRVKQAGNLSRVIIDVRKIGQIHDALDNWGWTSGQSQLSEEEAQRLLAALQQSGLSQRPPVGRWLDSRAYYWIAVGCRNGGIVFNAWSYPSERYDRLRFPDILARFDRTGIPHPPAVEVDASGRLQARMGPGAKEFTGVDFEVEVGESELTGWR